MRKFKCVVERRLYFAWSNLIDGECVPKASPRSEKPPGSCIWKASVYFWNANAAHLKGYKLPRNTQCECAGVLCRGAEAPLMSGSSPHSQRASSPAWTLTATHKPVSKEAGDREASLAPEPCLLLLLPHLKTFNGRLLHKVCRRLRCSACHMRASLRTVVGVTMPTPPLLSSLLPLLAPSLVLHWEALRKGGGDPGRLMCPLWSSARHTE